MGSVLCPCLLRAQGGRGAAPRLHISPGDPFGARNPPGTPPKPKHFQWKRRTSTMHALSVLAALSVLGWSRGSKRRRWAWEDSQAAGSVPACRPQGCRCPPAGTTPSLAGTRGCFGATWPGKGLVRGLQVRGGGGVGGMLVGGWAGAVRLRQHLPAMKT